MIFRNPTNPTSSMSDSNKVPPVDYEAIMRQAQLAENDESERAKLDKTCSALANTCEQTGKRCDQAGWVLIIAAVSAENDLVKYRQMMEQGKQYLKAHFRAKSNK